MNFPRLTNPHLIAAKRSADQIYGAGGTAANADRCPGCGKPLMLVGPHHVCERQRNDTTVEGKRTYEGTPLVVNVVSVVWPAMDEAAYYGLAGDVVKTIAPHTEADPVAILIQVLTYFGNVVGRCPYYQIEADRHHANLFIVLVGESAKGRKGTSGGRARSVFMTADASWIENRMKGGLSSGEGLINEVRDERKEWNRKEKRYEIADPGIPDKRLLVTEPEFASALAVMERPGNTLSPVMRSAWDGLSLDPHQEFPAQGDGAAHLDLWPHHHR